MSTEKAYPSLKRKCRNVSACDWPICECPLAPPVEIAAFDPAATREALKESRKEHTVKIKTKIP
jgi:hypothetical protein